MDMEKDFNLESLIVNSKYFIVKNLTDFRKTVETGVYLRQ